MSRVLNIFIPHCSGLLTDHLPHGDGLVAHGFIAKLAERGHNLYVAAERVELSRKLPLNAHVFSLGGSNGRRSSNRLSYMLKVRGLFGRLRREVKFDVIHQLNPVYTGVSLALWGAQLPVVLGPYVADWPVDPYSLSATVPVLRRFVRSGKEYLARVQQAQADVLLLTTEAAEMRVIEPERGKPIKLILPHGIDCDFFTPAKDSSSSLDQRTPPSILFFANVSKRKGIFDLLSAFELLSRRVPEVELWIAGSGEDLSAVQGVASTLESRANIRFLGRKTRDEAVELLRKATICCLPSHGEPYGMSIAEAMSCGRPVVVTDSGGLGCLVDNEGGIRVPERNPERLAEALSCLLDDPGRRISMGAHNRRKALKTMTWDIVIDRLEQVYRSSCGADADEERLSKPGVMSASSIQDYSEAR